MRAASDCVVTSSKISGTYVLVSAVSANDGDLDRLDTQAVYPTGGRERVCPSLYTGRLAVTSGPASRAEVAAVEAAAEAAAGDGKVAAVAYVRGTANPSTAEAWRVAREQLGLELTAKGLNPVAALPGQGWDFTTGHAEITFWSASPLDDAERRRAEKQVAANVGGRYRVWRYQD